MLMRLAALILALLFLSTGCAAKTAPQTPPESTVSAALTPELLPTPVFTNGGTHRSTKDYSQVFTFLTAYNDACTLNIETKIFDEARATRLWETVTNDLKTIAANVPMRQDMPEIYVVQKPLHGIERIGYCLYCAAEDVESGAYREALVCAALNLDPLANWWKTKGLVDYAFGETADEEFLRTYYEQADDEKLQILSLFPAYFVREFASEEERSVARETALSLTAYMIDRYGVEGFFESDGGYRQEWLTALGLDRTFFDPYAQTFAGYRYSFSLEYPLIVTTDRQDIFYLEPMPDDMETPRQICDFLHEAKTGISAYLDAVKAEAPERLQDLLNNYAAPISYYLSSKGHSLTFPDTRKVTLRHSSHVLHETVHIMVPEKGEEAWKYEAIAQYFTNTFYPPMAERKMAFKAITELADTKVEADTDPFMEWILRGNAIYLEHAKMPEKIEDMGHALYVKSRIEAYLRHPREGTKYPSVAESYLITASAHVAPVEGNELSYEEAYLFSDYLIEKYSLSAFLWYCLRDSSFLEAFGAAYEDAKTEWLAYVLAG
ncbi:MAG: hypothetical protein LLF87_03950 [Eubacteriales bacterium]|nr:hypothetical protein [Eubacteriales bacterium]